MRARKTPSPEDGTITQPLPPDETVPPASYAESRKTLRAIADRLRHDTEIDIDELIPLIDQASAAYKICRERVDAVEKLIAERLPQTENASGEEV